MALFKKKQAKSSAPTPQKEEKTKKRGRLRELRSKFANAFRLITIFVTYIVLTAVVVVMLLTRINGSETSIIERSIANVLTPIQSVFSDVISSLANELQKLKLRGTLEKEYNRLLAENEKLVYDAMFANELQIELSQYKALFDEISLNAALNPIACRVIGRDPGNYFSVFTINKGSDHGLDNFMAVTANGALIGYTYNVTANKADVRTIIDSEASIAALIQSSRDQGTVRGTLGIDGRPLCRMYYLPDENLPRPGDEVVTSGVGMSFPRGIPIGTVRESTRGLEENKLYIVVEPKNDFRHVENVIVLRYMPEPIGITALENGTELNIYDPIPSIMPIPTIFIGKDMFILEATPSPVPPGYTETATATPKPSPTHSGTVAGTPSPGGVYVVPNPTATPPVNFTLGPTATPKPTPPPLDITIED